MVSLSKRLHKIADWVPRDSRLADIGSDHALLPVFLIQQGAIASAIAGELNPGPFAAAQKQVLEADLAKRIQVRRGDGLEVIEPGEAEVISIAGMGGQLIVQILSAGLLKLEGVHTLILQPNVGEGHVRRWLLNHGWFLAEEHILTEDGKTYEIIKAVRSHDAEVRNELLYRDQFISGVAVSQDRLLAMGPYLLSEGSPVFGNKWLLEINKLEKICEQLSHSKVNESINRRKAMLQEIDIIKQLIHFL